MYGNGLVEFGRFGVFRGRRFPKKRNFAHYMYGNGLVEFGVFWGGFLVVWCVSMDRTTAMLTDQIRKRVCLAL